jgi:hypothetical protein
MPSDEPKKKRPYTPPRVVSLSGGTAQGEIQGLCIAGTMPAQHCGNGGIFGGRTCGGSSVVTSFCFTDSDAEIGYQIDWEAVFAAATGSTEAIQPRPHTERQRVASVG